MGIEPDTRTEAHYRLLFELAAAGIVVVEADGTIAEVNPAYCRLLGYRAQELVGTRIADVTHPDDREETRRVFEELRTGERESVDIEKRYRRRDGSTVWVHVTGAWLFDEASNPTLGVGLVQDISARRRAEEELRESNERIKAIVIAATDAIVTIDKRGVIENFNPAAERMFGYSAPEALGQNVSLLMPSPYREEHDGYIARYLKTGEAKIIGIGREVEGRRKDGSSFPIELAVSEVDHLGLFTGIIRDISDRKRSESALAESERRLRGLTARLLTVQEEERRHISRELHDVIGQKLTLLRMHIDQLGVAEGASPSGTRFGEEILRLQELLESIAVTVRNLSHQLHPSAVEHLGLIVALRKECDTVRKSTGRAISFRAGDDVPRRLPLAGAMCLYRVAQEALQNAVKHSPDADIDVTLEKLDDEVHLSIIDTGEGFESNGERAGWGLGLVSMEERARVVDGTLEVQSAPGRGTSVRCRVPVHMDDDDARRETE